MSDQLNQIYRVADGGPFTLAIENGDRDIIIENVTDDLVNAGILIPDDSLQQIADFVERWRKDHCYSDDDCVLDDSKGVGQSVDMSDFWKEWDGLVNEVAPDQDPNHPNYMGEPT